MKRAAILFCFLLIVPFVCFSQNKIALSHFWDIPWGTSIEQAERIFTERGLVSFRDRNSLITTASYEWEDAVIILLFNNANRFYCGNVVYAGSESVSIPKYNEYRLVLFRRYGMPDTTVEYYAEPYEKDDGKTIEAIESENAFFYTEWNFRDRNQASVSILSNLDVCLSFRSPGYAGTGIGRL